MTRNWDVDRDQQYCDNCGKPLEGNLFFVYHELPWDIDSANKGESGVVCSSCVEKLQRGDKLPRRSDRIIETFNRNLIETGALGARRSASKEIAHMAKVDSQLLGVMAKLRLEHDHILQLWSQLGHPQGLELAAMELRTIIDRLDEERNRHADV